MVRVWPLAILMMTASLPLVHADPQEPAPKPQEIAPEPAADSFFSGTVAELEQEKVIVARTILGKPAEKRTFLLNADTKVEGKLKPKSRVTVRFAAGEQGEVALAILVRDKEKKDPHKK